MTKYWVEHLPALFDSHNLWIEETMSFNEKLNAITRLVLILAVVGFAATQNEKLIVAGVVTLGALTFLWYTRHSQREGFEHFQTKPGVFTEPTPKNPLMNVMMSDDPERPRAAPSFNPDIENEINVNAKKMITKGDIDVEDKLFGSLGDDAQFKNSMRNFYPTANTQIPNDQEAFLKFCYQK